MYIGAFSMHEYLRRERVILQQTAPPALYPEPPESVLVAANTSQRVPRISGGCKRRAYIPAPFC